MQTVEIVLAIAGVMFGSSVIASGITAFFARKKISAEAQAAVAEGSTYAVGSMQKVLERMENELAETRRQREKEQKTFLEKIKHLELNLSAAQVEITALRKQLAQVLEQNRPADN